MGAFLPKSAAEQLGTVLWLEQRAAAGQGSAWILHLLQVFHTLHQACS